MESHIAHPDKLFSTATNLITICLAMEGLSQLLEEASNSDQNQAHQISCGNAILKTIIRQAHEVTDTLTRQTQPRVEQGETFQSRSL